ncbi:hypothetical protein ACFVSW_27980, partial [Neobacillus sp. NPDC058068]|uniref:hypothetical protein n=1 Tax=Neobacillus sp. NPDC058068 TaxID=3346325 RepID=UPI0036DDA877
MASSVPADRVTAVSENKSYADVVGATRPQWAEALALVQLGQPLPPPACSWYSAHVAPGRQGDLQVDSLQTKGAREGAPSSGVQYALVEPGDVPQVNHVGSGWFRLLPSVLRQAVIEAGSSLTSPDYGLPRKLKKLQTIKLFLHSTPLRRDIVTPRLASPLHDPLREGKSHDLR